MPSLNFLAREANTRKKPTKKAVEKTSTPSFKSTEFVEESDEESDEGSNKDSASDEGFPISDPTASIPKINATVAASTTSSGSSSGVDSKSASESSRSADESSSEEVGEDKIAKNLAKAAKSAKRATKGSTTKPAPFGPTFLENLPLGFEPATIDTTSDVSQLFDKSNLEGKLIWYITAPASLPIASITKMSLKDVKEGKTIFSHNNNNYGFVQDTAENKTFTKVMVPINSENGYRTGLKPIDQILHLQQIVKLPAVYDSATKRVGSPMSARATVPAKKPIRKQPPNLQMRFRPIGFGGGSIGDIGSSSSSDDGSSTKSDSDNEMQDAQPQFRHPVTLRHQSINASSSASESEDSSSSSDAAITKLRAVPSSASVNSQSYKSSAIEVSSEKDALNVGASSLKRKPSRKGDKKSKKVRPDDRPKLTTQSWKE